MLFLLSLLSCTPKNLDFDYIRLQDRVFIGDATICTDKTHILVPDELIKLCYEVNVRIVCKKTECFNGTHCLINDADYIYCLSNLFSNLIDFANSSDASL